MPNEQKTSSKKRIWLIPVCILAAVALIAAIVLAAKAERKAVLIKTLTTFYDALYIESDLDAMKACIAEDAREDFESVMSMGGITPGYYRNYVQDALLEIGTEFIIGVRITSLSEYGTSDIAKIQQTFPDTEKAVRAEYEIIFTDTNGEDHVYTNSMIFVKVDNHWYMSTHLALPIGANMSISNS